MNAQFATGAPRLKSPVRATACSWPSPCHRPRARPASGRAQRRHQRGQRRGRRREAETAEVQLLVGRSTLVNIGSAITRVSLTSPDIADAMVTTPNQLLVHGKTPGTISMFVWDKPAASSATRSPSGAISASWSSR